MNKFGYVYIITNKHHTTLYIGVTSDLQSRMWQHENKFFPKSFSARYNLDKLVFYKLYDTIEEAILQEKKLKGWYRAKKENLIALHNPEWADLGIDVANW